MIEAITICIVNASPKTIHPIIDASTGTLNCTVAAVVDLTSGKALYQIA